jgi:serine phosphatase RsbU (regulator of sigma subunit)
MDLILICLDENNKLSFSGAYRPLLLIKKDSKEITTFKTTKAAIGGLTADNQLFATEEIQMQAGDTIYLFTDGYADQFNPNSKKLMSKRFKEILINIQHLELNEQKTYLDQYHSEWANNEEQTDDVLVIGVRV